MRTILVTATKTHDPSRTGRWLAACACLVASAPAAAAEFAPAITIGVTRSDNVALAADDPQSDTVFRLMPDLRVTQASPRLTADAAYRLEAYYYDDRRDSEAFHLFDGELSAALDADNFFLETGVRRSQAVRDPESPIPFGHLSISLNRIERDDYYLGPSFQYALGSAVTARGNVRRTWVHYDYDESAASLRAAFRAEDYENDRATFSFDNHRRGSGASWAVRYDADRTEYDLFGAWESRQALVELGFWAGGGLRLFAAGGKESAWDRPFDPSLEDTFWEAGFAHRPGTKLRVEAAAGERSFGDSRRGELEYEFMRGRMALSYSMEPTTEARAEFFRRGGLLPFDPNAPEDHLTAPGSPERYLATRGQWSVSFTLRRTELSFLVFDETREERMRIDGARLDDLAQTGANVTLSRSAGRRTRLFLRGSRTERTFGAGAEQDILSASAGAELDFGQRTRLSLEYEHWKEAADERAQGRRYTANLLSVSLTRTFF